MRVSIFAGALALAVLIAGQASAAEGKCEPDALAAKYPTLVGKTIRVAQSGEGAPFTFRDPEDFEKLIGLDADLVRVTFACIGVSFEFKTGGWSGLLPSVIAGQSDLMWSNLYYTPARAEQVDFVTYLLAATGGMVKKGNPKNIHSLDDACGVRAAAGLGTVEEAMFRGVSDKCVAAGKPAIELVTYADRPSGIRMVQNDRADLLMGDLGSMDFTIAQLPNELERGYMMLRARTTLGPDGSIQTPRCRTRHRCAHFWDRPAASHF